MYNQRLLDFRKSKSMKNLYKFHKKIINIDKYLKYTNLERIIITDYNGSIFDRLSSLVETKSK